MTKTNNLTQSDQSLAKPMLIGAAAGLVLIAFFVFGADKPNPQWGKFWMIKPLIITPLAGAAGGLFYYFMHYVSSRGGLNKTVAVMISLVAFIIALWLGTVLGLNGTMWN